MTIKVISAEANGNTFQIFDYISSAAPHNPADIRSIFDPQLTDSALVLEKSNLVAHSSDPKILMLKMYVYEPGDGFCGNGSRAVCHYLKTHPEYSALFSEFAILCDGFVHNLIQIKDSYCVNMGNTAFILNNEYFITDCSVFTNAGILTVYGYDFHYGYTSEPHLVCFNQANLSDKELSVIGCKIQKMIGSFPRGINVSSCKVDIGNKLHVTTFERGIDRLTKACGTGSVTAVSLAKKIGLIPCDQEETAVFVAGGIMRVTYHNSTNYLSGETKINL